MANPAELNILEINKIKAVIPTINRMIPKLNFNRDKAMKLVNSRDSWKKSLYQMPISRTKQMIGPFMKASYITNDTLYAF